MPDTSDAEMQRRAEEHKRLMAEAEATVRQLAAIDVQKEMSGMNQKEKEEFAVAIGAMRRPVSLNPLEKLCLSLLKWAATTLLLLLAYVVVTDLLREVGVNVPRYRIVSDP